MVKARDIMKKEIISVHPEMPVDELGRFFIEHDISGAPVMDAQGQLKGIVTEYDLISQSKKFHIPSMLRIFDAIIPLEGSEAMKKEIQKMAASQVADICTTDVIAINEDTPIEEIATIMAEKHITLLPVVRDGKVVGVVGKHEVIRGVAGEAPEQ